MVNVSDVLTPLRDVLALASSDFRTEMRLDLYRAIVDEVERATREAYRVAARELYDRGLTMPEIGQRIGGLSSGQVRYLLGENRPKRRRGRTQPIEDAVDLTRLAEAMRSDRLE